MSLDLTKKSRIGNKSEEDAAKSYISTIHS